MLIQVTFYSMLIMLILCAALFIVPPLWLTAGTAHLSRRTQIIASGWLVLLLVIFSWVLYWKLGAAQDFFLYYRDNNTKQQSAKLIRPLYARLQRELIKNQLNIQLDANNIELILNFAQIQAQTQQGILEPATQTLLAAVLNAIPQQVTALNLLAINAYKKGQYDQAITYWQAILSQFTAEMRNTKVEEILKNKIASCKELRHLTKN